MLYPCPSCGTPESSWGDRCCGPCEEERQREEAAYQRERLARCQGDAAPCNLRECPKCVWKFYDLI